MTVSEIWKQPGVGLALGSGAAKGWAHIGVIRALEAEGIRPDVVCGTSIGAIVGAAYAADDLDEFEEWGRSLEWTDMVSYLDLSFRGGLIRARRLFEFFEQGSERQTIESLKRPFAAVGTDLRNGQEVWMRSGSLLDALRASVAIPGLITPWQWKGRWMVDGGLVNPVPVSLCRALGADRVIAVDLNTTLLGRRLANGATSGAEAPAPVLPEQVGPELEQTGLQAVLRKLAAEVRDRIGSGDDELREETPTIYDVMANSINIMQVRIGRSRMAGDPPELLITPRMSDFGILDFDRAEEAIEEGRRAVAQALLSGA